MPNINFAIVPSGQIVCELWIQQTDKGCRHVFVMVRPEEAVTENTKTKYLSSKETTSYLLRNIS